MKVLGSSFYWNRWSSSILLFVFSSLIDSRGGSIWASFECRCCFWIAGGLVSYLTMWPLTLQLFKNSFDTQEKLRLNLRSVSVSELLEYGRKFLSDFDSLCFWSAVFEHETFLQQTLHDGLSFAFFGATSQCLKVGYFGHSPRNFCLYFF
jgi:hypothetical protein